MNTASIEQKEQLAQYIWTGFILFFFLVQAVIWTVAFAITASDSSHAVVANYEDQALRWDDVQSAKRASAALGWDSTLLIDKSADVRGDRTITLTLLNRAQKGVEHATIALRAFHCGRAAEVQRLSLTETDAGVYSSTIQVRHEGQWQFAGSAVVGEHTFLIDDRVFVAVEGTR